MIKAFVKQFLAKRGLLLIREPSISDFLATRNVDLVVDVGANEGQFGCSLRRWGYVGRIYSFEPLPTAFPVLARHAASDDKWTVTNVGVGSNAGELTINVAKNTVFSSFRKTTELATEFDSNSETVQRATVPIVTLDTMLADEQARSIFLKIDTQGFEQEVLTGADRLLERCVGALLELPVDHLYEQVWSFNDALAYLDGKGFVPAQFRAVNPRKNDRASALEFDCIFRRKD